MNQLTQRQHDFVINYIKNGFNVYQAAIDAGYSPSFAKSRSGELIHHPIINEKISKAYQAEEMKNMKEICMSMVDKAKVLDRIIRAVVPLDPNEPVNMKYASEAIKAVAELNKMQGDYAPDKRLSITVDATKERLIEARKQYDEY